MNSFLKTSVACFLRAKDTMLGTGDLQGRRYAPDLKELKHLVWGLLREVRWEEQPMQAQENTKKKAASKPIRQRHRNPPGPDVHSSHMPMEFMGL